MVYYKTIQLSPITQKYVDGLNDGTRKEFASRLWKLECFFKEKYGSHSIEYVITQLKKGKINSYQLMVDFKNHPLNKKLNAGVIRGIINTAVNFIEEVTDLEISRNKLKKRLHLGRPDERDEHPLDRAIVVKLLSTCTNPRLKAYLHLICAIGCRPKQEALSLRIKDVMFDSERPHIHFPAAVTKTNKERNPFMTQELIETLKIWLDYKYRERNRVSINNGNGNNKTITEKITPAKNGDDLLFSGYEDSKINSMYVTITSDFHKLLKDVELDQRHEDRRHHITLKSFRAFVRSQISDQGHLDYAEYHIGHKNSPYWKRTDAVKYETFKKIEPAITYLNIDAISEYKKDVQSRQDIHEDEISALNKRYVDLQSERSNEQKRIEELEKQNRKLDEKDKEIQLLKDRYETEMKEMRDHMDRQLGQIMSMIQQNPQLAQVKPERLSKKTKLIQN